MSHCQGMLQGAHWEVRKGSHKQAKAYCMKAETRVEGPFELGVEPCQGARNDMKAVVEQITAESTVMDIMELNRGLFVRYHRGLVAIRDLLQTPRVEKTRVIILYGPTGCGKTRAVYDYFGPASVYSKDKTQWWDGYENQLCVLIDEFYGQVPYGDMLELMDRYQQRVQVKGGYKQFNSRVICICTNKNPMQFYRMEHDWKPAFFRRVDYIFEWSNQWHIWDMAVGTYDVVSNKRPIEKPVFDA